MMLIPVAFSLGVIFLTILIHGVGTAWGVQLLLSQKHFTQEGAKVKYAMYYLSLTAVYLMILHFIEIAVWAIVFLLIPNIEELATFEEAIYFSMVTYATLGYGDITLGPYWRIMSGFEAMNGILLFGWSTAMFFSAVQKILGQPKLPASKSNGG